MPFEITELYFDNEDIRIETDESDNLSIYHKPSGEQLTYNTTDNQWEIDGISTNSVTDITTLITENIPQHGTIISTIEPSVADPGTTWARIDDPGSEIWSHSLHSGSVLSVFERNGVVYSGSGDTTVKAVDASARSDI